MRACRGTDGDSRAFSLSQGEPNFAQMIGGSGSCGAGHATLSGCGIRSCAFRAEDSGAVWNARCFPVVRGDFLGGRGSAFMPFQSRAEILFRWRRRNFFLPAICARVIREKASAVWRAAMRLPSLRGAWIRPAREPVPPAGFGGFKETLAGSLCALLFPCRVWRVRAALCCRFCAASSRSRRRWASRRGACRRACRPAHTRRSLRSLWAVRRGRRKIPRHCAFHSQCELVGKFARRLEAYLECGEVLDEFRLALWGDRQVFHVGRFVHENRRYPPFGVLYGGGGESNAVVRGGGLPV